MQLGRVIGDVVATHKDPNFAGVKLLLVQPIGADGAAAGRALVAVDAAGAGVGEHVFFVRGKEASFPFYPVEVPADAGIVGIVDHWNAEPPVQEVRSAEASTPANTTPEERTNPDVRSAGAPAPATGTPGRGRKP